MPISIDCPCGKRLQVSEKHAAQQGLCPSCGRTLDIPAATVPLEVPRRLQAVESPPSPEAEAAPRPEGGADGRWRPPAELKDHGGGALPDNVDFFVPPPADIGEVVSAYSSLRSDVQPTAAGMRAALVIICGGAGLGGGVILGGMAQSPLAIVLLSVVLGGIGLIVALYLTRFRYRCTYIGREGVARFRCSGSRGNLDIAEVFRFRDAAELRVSQTSRYVNGAYTGTEYTYSWTAVAGHLCYRIAGNHRYHNKQPPITDPYQYALAAEVAWSNYLLRQVRARLLTADTIYFGLGGGDWVRLGERKMIVCLKGQTTECHADDVAGVRIHQGWFEVCRKDAQRGWFSSTGVFKFPYGNLGNAQLFLFLLDQLVGVPISG